MMENLRNVAVGNIIDGAQNGGFTKELVTGTVDKVKESVARTPFAEVFKQATIDEARDFLEHNKMKTTYLSDDSVQSAYNLECLSGDLRTASRMAGITLLVHLSGKKKRMYSKSRLLRTSAYVDKSLGVIDEPVLFILWRKLKKHSKMTHKMALEVGRTNIPTEVDTFPEYFMNLFNQIKEDRFAKVKVRKRR